MNLPRLLVIDDRYGHDEGLRQLFCEQLLLWDMGEGDEGPPSPDGYLAQVRFCSGQKFEWEADVQYVVNDMEGVVEAIGRGWPFKDGGRWSLILIDYQFPTGRVENGTLTSPVRRADAEFGQEIARKIVELWPFMSLFEGEAQGYLSDIPFAMFSMCDPDEVEPHVDPLGSSGYMRRPVEMSEGEGVILRAQLAKLLFRYGLVEDGALRTVTTDGEVKAVREQKIVGRSLAILRALRRCRAATTKEGLNVIFVYGGIGTGKELFAEYIHDHSRLGTPYYAQSLDSIPDTLIHTELFGYDEGTFTGQIRGGKMGLLELAGPGGLFLDEIGNCPPATLRMLLRATAGGSFSRVGSGDGRPIRLRCQVICATNVDIPTLVSERGFTPDLLSRFNAAGVTVPPLAARNGDKKILFDHFVKREVDKLGCRPKRPREEVYRWIDESHWQFNVRQLESAAVYVVGQREESGTIQLYDIKTAVAATSQHFGEPQRPKSFESLMNAIETFVFPPVDAPQVRGAMPRFSKAAGRLISRMLEAAATLPGHRDRKGEPIFTTCVSTIRGGEGLSPDAAKRYFINTLQKYFVLDSESKVVGQFIKRYPRPAGQNGGEE